MSSITISDLRLASLNASSNSENYLNDLSEAEQNIQGGLAPIATIGLVLMGFGSVGIGASLGVLAARAWDKV